MRPPRAPFVRREVERFKADPSSIRKAAIVIIVVTFAAVVVGSLVMWLFDKRDFPDFGTAFWFTLQTVTTVGYGDVTPTSTLGRTVAGIVMVVAIGFLTIVTALITSTFIDAAQRARSAATSDAQADAVARSDARFDEVMTRLTAIEAALVKLGVPVDDPLADIAPVGPPPADVPTSGPPPGDDAAG